MPKDSTKSELIAVRVTPKEKADITNRTRQMGITPSQLLRTLLNAEIS